MPLIPCYECDRQISTEASSCPHCGAPRKPSAAANATPSRSDRRVGFWLIGGLVLIVVIASLSSTSSDAPVPIDRTPSVVTATNNPSPSEPQVTPPENWAYQDRADQMGRGRIKTAAVRSTNEFAFDFPYREPQHATLLLRVHPEYGRDVILQIERGQFLCRLDECTVNVRFDSGTTQAYTASEPADNSTTALFIRNYERFVRNLRTAKKVSIEAQFFQEGARVFEFSTAGLKW